MARRKKMSKAVRGIIRRARAMQKRQKWAKTYKPSRKYKSTKKGSQVTTYYSKEGRPGVVYKRTLVYSGDKVTNWGTASMRVAGYDDTPAGKSAAKSAEKRARERYREEKSRLRAQQRASQEAQTQAELVYLGELKGEQQRLYGQQEKKLTTRRWGPRTARARKAQLTELRKRKAKLKPLTGYSWAEQIQKYMKPTSQKLNTLNKRLSGRTKKATGRKLSGRTGRKAKR